MHMAVLFSGLFPRFSFQFISVGYHAQIGDVLEYFLRYLVLDVWMEYCFIGFFFRLYLVIIYRRQTNP